MTWEAHLFFELIHFLLKKPFHQLQFLFNFNHSSLHYSYQLFLGSLKGEKNVYHLESRATLKTLLVIFPTKCLEKGQPVFAFVAGRSGYLMIWEF